MDEIESNEYLANSLSILLKDIPQETIINITKALDSCNFSEIQDLRKISRIKYKKFQEIQYFKENQKKTS